MSRDALKQSLQKYLEPQVREAVRQGLEPLTKQATSWMTPILSASSTTMENFKPEDKGLGAARLIRCFAAGKGDCYRAARFAAKEYGKDSLTTKALMAGDATAGGFLVPDQMATEVIELLRPVSVVRQMGPRFIQAAKGSFDFPRLDQGASASYIGEGGDIVVSQPQFGQVRLTAKKLAALVPVSNDLLKFGVNADAVVRDDLVETLATAEDVNLLRGDGLLSKPLGLRNRVASANVSASNGTTATNIEDDFKDLLNALEGNDVPMRRPVWLMSPRSKNHLLSLRDANGNLIFPELLSSPTTSRTILVAALKASCG
jgi:HK97 family phage major capsid protein